MKIFLLSSDPNHNVTGRITSILNDSWIRLAETNKENTLPCMACFRDTPHLLCGNIPIIQELTSGLLIYTPWLSSEWDYISEYDWDQEEVKAKWQQLQMKFLSDPTGLIPLPPLCKLISMRNQPEICLHWLFKLKDLKN